MPLVAVTIDEVTAWRKIVLSSARFLAVLMAVLTLFKLLESEASPFNWRVPARAARSATAWAWARALAIRPMSTANAIIATRAMMPMIKSGRTEPLRVGLRRCRVMVIPLDCAGAVAGLWVAGPGS